MSTTPDRVRLSWAAVAAVVLALLLAGVAWLAMGAGDDPGEPTVPAAGTGADAGPGTSGQWVDAGELRGTVLHDGKPLKGVKVGLYGGDAATHPVVSAVSDAGGRFRLVGVPTGTDLLLETSGAQPGGGRQGSEWAPVEAVPIRLEAGRGLGGVELEVSRTNEVTGRLVLANGTPVVGVDVIAYREASRTQQELTGSERDEWGRVATDAKGRWRLTRIPDGQWFIGADETFGFVPSAPGSPPIDDPVQEATLETFVPIRATTAEKVEVAGGSRVKVPAIEVARGRVVTGVVTDEAGAPVAGAMVALQVPREEWQQVRTVSTDERGRYSFIRLKAVRARVTVLDPLGRAGVFPTADAGPDKKRSTFLVSGRTVADVRLGG